MTNKRDTTKRKPARKKKTDRSRRDLTEAEAALVDALEAERAEAVPFPYAKLAECSDGAVKVTHDTYDDYRVSDAMVCRAFGTIEHGYAATLINDTAAASASQEAIASRADDVVNKAVLAATSLDAQSPAEGMLIAQMVAVHNTAMSALTRYHAAKTIPVADSYSNQANKLLRTFAAQMETLKRFRQKASQTVRVDHVHVNEGGQAIVGNVNQGGGGAQQKSEVQPHETKQPANGQGPEMRGTQSTGEALPSPGDAGEKEMPVAWREVARSAVG